MLDHGSSRDCEDCSQKTLGQTYGCGPQCVAGCASESIHEGVLPEFPYASGSAMLVLLVNSCTDLFDDCTVRQLTDLFLKLINENGKLFVLSVVLQHKIAVDYYDD